MIYYESKCKFIYPNSLPILMHYVYELEYPKMINIKYQVLYSKKYLSSTHN